MATALSITVLLVIVGVTISDHRRGQRFADFTPEQLAASRKTMVRADYRAKIERAWGERLSRWFRRIEVRLRIAVPRRERGPAIPPESRM